MQQLLPLTDVLIGNESEAAAFAAKAGWPEGETLEQTAMRLSQNADGSSRRLTIVTQGSEATLVVEGGVCTSYPVPAVAGEEIVDTNGAGDGRFAVLFCAV